MMATHHVSMGIGHESSALKEIQAASTLLQALDADGTMVESRLLLPNDQMLAVFCPLIVPLVAPLLFGCFREAKRFKSLKSK